MPSCKAVSWWREGSTVAALSTKKGRNENKRRHVRKETADGKQLWAGLEMKGKKTVGRGKRERRGAVATWSCRACRLFSLDQTERKPGEFQNFGSKRDLCEDGSNPFADMCEIRASEGLSSCPSQSNELLLLCEINRYQERLLSVTFRVPI